MLPFCERRVLVLRNRYILRSERGLQLPLVARSIGERLRKNRAELKLTQLDVARHMGVSTVSISRWERDIGVIRDSHRALIDGFLSGKRPVDLSQGQPT